jgi:hypothetical protein
MRLIGTAAALVLLGSCAIYGDRTGAPPGPVAASSSDGPPPTHAGELTPMQGHGGDLLLAAGIYAGELVVQGNGNRVTGAGPDQTIIEGGLKIMGDGNVLGGLRVQGASQVLGNENDVRGVVFEQTPEMLGDDNLVR